MGPTSKWREGEGTGRKGKEGGKGKGKEGKGRGNWVPPLFVRKLRPCVRGHSNQKYWIAIVEHNAECAWTGLQRAREEDTLSRTRAATETPYVTLAGLRRPICIPVCCSSNHERCETKMPTWRHTWRVHRPLCENTVSWSFDIYSTGP